jgi:putative flavoprotein involved in K+ transport
MTGRAFSPTSAGPIEARDVVIATGPFQRPIIPALIPQETEVFQLHSCGYRNPDQLPDGAVLVVGTGASGAQIAEELRLAGRRVYLSVSRHRRLPRRYRGHDFRWWWAKMGTLETPLEKRGLDLSPNVITGAYGGYTIDFRRFAAQGTVLLGRAEKARDGVMSFAPDLLTNLAHGDAAYTAFLDSVDAYASGEGIDAPEDPDARVPVPDPPCVIEPIRNLNPRDEGITTVIWATGYTLDFGWIDLPVFNKRGMPIHRCGVTDVQGLYFLGLQWLSRMESGLVYGVGHDAAYIADHIDTLDRRQDRQDFIRFDS